MGCNCRGKGRGPRKWRVLCGDGRSATFSSRLVAEAEASQCGGTVQEVSG